LTKLIAHFGGKRLQLAHGTAEEKLQRWGEYQIEVDRLHELNSTLSYEDMAKSAAKKFGVCIKTIKRHTDNPRKK
jgi:hypothetical protein